MVIKEPFENFIANIETYETDQRTWIFIDLIGGKTKIQTPPDIIKVSD